MQDHIINKDGFFFFKKSNSIDSIVGDMLIVEQDSISKIVKYVQENNIKGLMINPSFSSISDLDFLQDVPNIQGLVLLQDDLDISRLGFLNDLKLLSFDIVKKGLDLSAFSALEVLSYTYSKSVKGVQGCHNLFWLSIRNYKKEDLNELKMLRKLIYLYLYNSGIINLKGIEQIPSLKEIRLDNAKKMESLSGLTEVQNTIEVLDIYNAQKLTDYSALKNMTSLKQLDLRRTGDIDSIEFIKYLTKIERITLGLKVKNGDMSFLKNIDSVGFIDYPHYNLKHKDFQN